MVRLVGFGVVSLIIASIIFKLLLKLLVPIVIIFGGLWLIRRVLRRSKA